MDISALKRFVWIPAFLVFGVVAFLVTPGLIRSYVESRYEGVSVHGDVRVGLVDRELRFTDVRVERPGIKATFKSVVVDSNKRVRLSGGDVRVDANALTTDHEGGDQQSNLASSVTVLDTEVVVLKGKYRVQLSGARYSFGTACFTKGSVYHPDFTVAVEEGCARTDRSRAGAKKVVLSSPLIERVTKRVPEFHGSASVTMTDVEGMAATRTVWFKNGSIGPVTVDKGHVRVVGPAIFADFNSVHVNHPWVAPHAVLLDNVGVNVPKDGGSAIVLLGNARLDVNWKERWIKGGDGLCSDWVSAIPEPLPSAMTGMARHFSGNLSFSVSTEPPDIKLQQTCRFSCSESPIKDIRGRRFTYMVYGSDGKMVERQTGPGTTGWVTLADLPERVPEAFRLLEDPGFLHHRGIHVMALKNSLIANLEKRRFIKGGSTITMQLAKNLWLRRDKAVGRKVHEAALTMALESCLTKAEIIELYVNVVEYGPNVYGIGPASRHYFQKSAPTLTADEAFYLASILPNPKRAHPPESGGIARARRIMQALASSGYLPETALAPSSEGLSSLDDVSGWDTN